MSKWVSSAVLLFDQKFKFKMPHLLVLKNKPTNLFILP